MVALGFVCFVPFPSRVKQQVDNCRHSIFLWPTLPWVFRVVLCGAVGIL